jgi:hypothetical protein
VLDVETYRVVLQDMIICVPGARKRMLVEFCNFARPKI